MGKVTGEACSADCSRDFEGESLPALAPSCCVAGVVPIEQECWGERLQESGEMHRSCRLTDAAFVAGNGDDHAIPFYIFARVKIRTDKNTKTCEGMQEL